MRNGSMPEMLDSAVEAGRLLSQSFRDDRVKLIFRRSVLIFTLICKIRLIPDF